MPQWLCTITYIFVHACEIIMGICQIFSESTMLMVCLFSIEELFFDLAQDYSKEEEPPASKYL